MPRIIIIGNSGSGKTYLAEQLSTRFTIPVIHLDSLYWEPGGFSLKRPKEVVSIEIKTLKTGEDWIVEGVFGELALQFAENAQHLIWLDMDWGNCKNNLLARGSESGQQLAPQKADQHFRELLEWAANYWTREDLRSHSGHKSIFADFDHWKIKLASKNEVDDFIQASEQYF